jgi:hypothetical protein
MRYCLAVGLMLSMAAGAFAQRHMGGRVSRPVRAVITDGVPFRTYGSPSGFGSVAFPGMGTPPPFTSTFGTTFVERLGNVVSGVPFTGVRGRHRRGFFHGGYFGGGPLAWPIVMGGLPYDYSYDQPQPPVVVAPAQPASPPVTINQNFAPPAGAGPEAASPGSNVQIYRAPAAQPSAPPDDQVLFFIALKDSSVYTASAYWVEDGTLHYVTPQGRHNQVSLDLVDRGVSARLNGGRNIDFRLPPS